MSLIVSLLASVIILSIVAYGWGGDRFLAWALATHDPVVFTTSGGDEAHVARIFLNREELLKYGDYGKIIRGTNKTFDLLAINATTTLNDYESAIQETLKNDVTIRILLFEADDKNGQNCQSLAVAIGEDCEADLKPNFVRAVHTLDAIQQRTKSNVALYHGHLEYKVYKRMVLYTMWLRDSGVEGSIGHIEVHQYQTGHSNWPSFTFAREAGPLVVRLHEEFDTVWNASTPP